MKKQDILTPIGLLLGISLIIFAISSGEVGLGGFYDVMSIIITIGGSFSALLITFPLDEMINILKMTKSLFTTPAVSKVEMIDTFKNLSMKSRKNGLNSLMTKDDICNKNKFYEEVLEALTGETIQKLDDAYYIDKKVYENVKKDLLEYLNKNKEITVAQFRDITKSNRKISIVMLEHFDRNRITKRVEDKRILY